MMDLEKSRKETRESDGRGGRNKKYKLLGLCICCSLPKIRLGDGFYLMGREKDG